MEKNEGNRLYPFKLLREEAEVVLCFLKKPVAKTPSDIRHELEPKDLKKIGWNRLQNILSALKFHNIIEFRDGERPLVVLNMNFYDDVKMMRIRLRLKKVKAEDDVGHNIPDFFDQYDPMVKRYILFEPEK